MNSCDNETILEAIGKAVKHSTRFFAYRMPGEKQLCFGAQIIDQLTPEGFLVNPFVESADCPPYFISAQFDAKKFLKLPVSALPVSALSRIEGESTPKEEYLANAEKCIADMQAGHFKKIVLSRVIISEHGGSVAWDEVFKKLLDVCPDSFVFIFNSEVTGAWLGASPERYLSYHGNAVSTMALAGTRPAGTQGEWSEKEIEEQKIVADYIAGRMDEAKMQYEMSPLYTRHAGNVEHLCNDFTGVVARPSQADLLLNMLHPTPALAGMPVKESVKYIGEIEAHRRYYYGGYIGPVDFRGNYDLFVNLRSLEADSERYCIYVGGGLTKDSTPEIEWEETCDKAALLQGVIP